MRNWLLIIVSIMLSTALTAQPYKEASLPQKIAAAESALDEYNYYGAMDMFNELYRETKDIEFLIPMADLNYRLRDYKRAERYFERIFTKIEPADVPSLLFKYARTVKQLGDYNKAYEIYKDVKEFSESDSLLNLVNNDIQGMVEGSKYEKDYDLYVTSLDETVNSPFSEYSPEIGPDGKLYFTTFNTRSMIKFDKDSDADWYAKVASSGQSDKEWTKPKNVSKKVNKERIHNSGNAFSKDGQVMFFTRQELLGQEIMNSRIFVSFYNGTDWDGARELTGVNGDWLAMYPAPGELYGEKVLFFVSDMTGTLGGLDIFYAPYKSDTEYGLPVNLGKVINTPGDERTPFYVDGNLYYSSDGLPGLGGLDIFKSEWNGSEWSAPVNMKLGYNSVNDDYYYRTDKDEKRGFLVSNRPNEKIRSVRSETCCDDIYSIGIREIELKLIVGTFDDKKKPLVGVTVELIETIDGRKTNETVEYTSPKGNSFIFKLQADKEYRIVATRDGYAPDSLEMNTMGVVQSYEYKEFVYLGPEEPETQIVTINEPIRLSSIYFDYDDDKIIPESESTLTGLQDLMNEYKDLVIELSAHTDARGNDTYNQNLSQRRAQSAKNWLVQKGIGQDRIKAVGYGEEKLLNDCSNGVDCTEEEHRLNRRVEFKILEGPRTIEVKKEVLQGKKKKVKRGKLDVEGTSGQIQKKTTGTSVASNSSSKPEIKFKNPFHDFGVMKQGEKKAYQIEFVNTGNAPLLIEMATACECTELDWPRGEIAPGETGIVDVIYDSKDKDGEQEVAVEILANTKTLINTARFRAFVK